MAKFIKLTLIHQRHKIFINPNFIEYFSIQIFSFTSGGDRQATRLKFSREEEDYIDVIETPEQIMAMLEEKK